MKQSKELPISQKSWIIFELNKWHLQDAMIADLGQFWDARNLFFGREARHQGSRGAAFSDARKFHCFSSIMNNRQFIHLYVHALRSLSLLVKSNWPRSGINHDSPDGAENILV